MEGERERERWREREKGGRGEREEEDGEREEGEGRRIQTANTTSKHLFQKQPAGRWELEVGPFLTSDTTVARNHCFQHQRPNSNGRGLWGPLAYIHRRAG